MTSQHTPAAAAVPGRHSCGSTNCDTDIPADDFMCEVHMKMLPPPLRHAIRDSYAAGQPITVNRYLTAAVDTIAHKETRSRPAGGSRQPVQLALY